MGSMHHQLRSERMQVHTRMVIAVIRGVAAHDAGCQRTITEKGG